MIKRKIYNELVNWTDSNNKKPLVIKGLRQIGKTYIVKQFAKENYSSVIYLDFRKQQKKDSGLEIDFVTRYKRKCTLIKVKAENNKAKSLNTVLGDYVRYHVDSAIKIREGNISKNENTLFLPHYLELLIQEY